MERIKQAFVESTGAFLRQWYLREAESQIKGAPEKTKNLGSTKLGELKAEVKQIHDDTDTTVTQIFSESRLWWHLQQVDQHYTWFGNRAPELLDKAIRLAAGRLASPLEKHGYLSKDYQERGVWREWDSSGNRHEPNARPYYPFNLDWSPDMRQWVDKYHQIHSLATKDTVELDKVKQEKAEAEAKGLWDKA